MIAELTGKTALVTGAAQGLGKTIALGLAKQGADVAVGDIAIDMAACTVDEIESLKRNSLCIHMDVSSRRSVRNGVSMILEAWDHLDILVNNAGVIGLPENSSKQQDIDAEWDYVLSVNVKGVIHCCDAVFPHMVARKYGKIVNISSTAGKPTQSPSGNVPRNQLPKASPYSASKAAVIRITQQLASQAAQHNINVNCVCPSRMVTPMGLEIAKRSALRDSSSSGKDPLEIRRTSVRELNLFDRELDPVDVAQMTTFMVSDDAKNITGQSINVDGGWCFV